MELKPVKLVEAAHFTLTDNIETTGTTLSGYNGTHCNLLNTEFFEKYITEIHVKGVNDSIYGLTKFNSLSTSLI